MKRTPASYKVQMGITKTLHIQELLLLCSAHRFMMLNTCMIFYEHILNGFSGQYFVTETATYKVQRDVTQYKSHGSCTLHVV